MAETDPGTCRWTVVVPQKDLRLAKSRMALGDAERRGIVLAMFEDTLEAIRCSPMVERVIVVCDNVEDALTLGRMGVITQVDEDGSGLNGSIEVGAKLARELLPDGHLAVLPADLPGLRAEELTHALSIAADHDLAFIADATGAGTTLLTATAGTTLRPAYGPSSRARHTLLGCFEIGRDNDLESLRDDVDDLEALQRVIAADGAHATRRALAALRPDTFGGLCHVVAP